MSNLSNAVFEIKNFKKENLGNEIAAIQDSLNGASTDSLSELYLKLNIVPSLFDSACIIKEVSAQIHEVVHAVGILLSLPYILYENETIEGLSLGAGNTGENFDLETNLRIAEFKFIHWKGGPESARKKQFFKDFYLLAEHPTNKYRYLYVIDDEIPLAFLHSNVSISSLLSHNTKLHDEFMNKFHGQFDKVHQYFETRKDIVNIIDLRKIVPEFKNVYMPENYHSGATNNYRIIQEEKLMNPSFEQVWQEITRSLKPGMEISNWTVLKGNLGGTITINSIGEDVILVESPNAKSILRVTKDKFELIWNVWAEYKKGRIQRKDISQDNFHSKYIISILHWWDINSK